MNVLHWETFSYIKIVYEQLCDIEHRKNSVVLNPSTDGKIAGHFELFGTKKCMIGKNLQDVKKIIYRYIRCAKGDFNANILR